MSNQPYSYHTFLFPFVWNNKGDISRDEFLECINEDYWVSADWTDGIIPACQHDAPQDKAGFFNDYQAYEYFIPNARNLLFNCDASGDVVRNFNFTIKGKPIRITEHKEKDADGEEKTDHRSNAQYIISKHINGAALRYFLQINGIRLRVFNSGVAILKIEAEFHGHKEINGIMIPEYEKTNLNERINDYNSINEYGRRINLPYIGGTTDDMLRSTHALVADEIVIRLEGCSEELREDFADTIIRLNKAEDAHAFSSDFSLTYIGSHIKRLIDVGSKRKVTSNRFNKESNEVYIYPIIDDRMFVCAMMLNGYLSETVKATDNSGEDYSIYSDKKLSETIYKLGFVETSCSCQSKVMRKQILKRCVYDRWIDYGTIDMITHHSVMRITGDLEDTGFISSVVNPFLLQYIPMAEIALCQRATILALFDRVDNATAGIDTDTGDLAASYKKIQLIQHDYVKAQNQIFLGDVTVQEQGVEEFRMMLNELYLDRTIAELDEQIKDAFDLADGYIEKKTNDNLNLITRVGAGLAALNMGIDLYAVGGGFPCIPKNLYHILGSAAMVGGIAMAVYYIIKHKKSKKNDY